MRIHHHIFGVVLASLLVASVAAQKRVLVDCPYLSDTPCADLTSDANAPIQWDPNSGSTQSQETGPTNGVNDAYYVFMETSNKDQGDNANLMTSELDVQGEVCVEFYYHMYGEEMGTLNLMVRSGSQNNAKWTKTGDQGDTWYHQRTTVNLDRRSDKIVFNGVRGNGYRGDMALDEIKITTMSCNDSSEVEPTEPPVSDGNLPLTCNFDSNTDTCSITQDINDAFDWAITLTGTPSSDTGPSRGYDNSPGFIFAEATGQAESDLARFTLPQLFTSGFLSCVQVDFYYHMYGVHMGDLKVYVGSNILFEAFGDQGDQWMKGSFQTGMTSDQRVTFEAVRGIEYASDIAVDAIKVTNCGGSGGEPSTISTTPTTTTTTVSESGGSGSVSFICTFDNLASNCSTTQDTNDDDNWIITSAATPSTSTGPSSGYGGTGAYIYYESTSRAPGERSRFALPSLVTSSSFVCVNVKFYYYMYGANLGTLNVYTRQGSQFNQNSAETMFSVTGDKGDQWLENSFTTSVNRDTRVVFEAVRGNGYASDIAVDSISVSDCSGSGGDDSTTPKPTTRNPTNIPYTVRLQPQAVWITKRYPAQLTCAVDDPEYISPQNLAMTWYFPNGSVIVGDASTPGFIRNYVYSANTSLASLGWWRTTLFIDSSFDYTMSGDYLCKVTYNKYPTTTKMSSLFFQGCPSGYFSCPRSEGCVPCSLLCDRKNDCGDWSDEFKCGGDGAPQCIS